MILPFLFLHLNLVRFNLLLQFILVYWFIGLLGKLTPKSARKLNTFFILIISIFYNWMLTAASSREDIGSEIDINGITRIISDESIDILHDVNEKINGNARLAIYYRLPSILRDHQINDEQEEYTIESPVAVYNTDKTMIGLTEEAPLLTSSMKRLSKLFKEESEPEPEPEAEREGEVVKADLKSFRKESDTYEYPVLVKSLKNVYKEMFITSSLYLLNIISAVGIVLVNKYIYFHYQFKHGLVLTFYHFLLTSIGLQVLASFKLFSVKPAQLIKVLPLSISFCSYVVLTNLSLQYNSGTFYQVKHYYYIYYYYYYYYYIITITITFTFIDIGCSYDRIATISILWHQN